MKGHGVSAEKALYTILSTTGGVTQYVGEKIYPVKIPEGTGLPAISYQQISGPREHNVSGAIGWVESRYQINSWAATYLEACDVATAVRVAIDGYAGTSALLVIDHIFVVDEGDVSNLLADNEELDMYGKRIDTMIVFKE